MDHRSDRETEEEERASLRIGGKIRGREGEQKNDVRPYIGCLRLRKPHFLPMIDSSWEIKCKFDAFISYIQTHSLRIQIKIKNVKIF